MQADDDGVFFFVADGSRCDGWNGCFVPSVVIVVVVVHSSAMVEELFCYLLVTTRLSV